jgi:predicted nucleic acid-binding protein
MMILIDTNIILDIFLKREPFFESSYEVIKQSATNNTECIVSATAITDIYYLLRKSFKDDNKAKEIIERLLQLVTVVDVLALDIQVALSDSIPDFEDAVVHAVALRNKVDYIVTRNIQDFSGSSVPVISPVNYLML